MRRSSAARPREQQQQQQQTGRRGTPHLGGRNKRVRAGLAVVALRKVAVVRRHNGVRLLGCGCAHRFSRVGGSTTPAGCAACARVHTYRWGPCGSTARCRARTRSRAQLRLHTAGMIIQSNVTAAATPHPRPRTRPRGHRARSLRESVPLTHHTLLHTVAPRGSTLARSTDLLRPGRHKEGVLELEPGLGRLPVTPNVVTRTIHNDRAQNAHFTSDAARCMSSYDEFVQDPISPAVTCTHAHAHIRHRVCGRESTAHCGGGGTYVQRPPLRLRGCPLQTQHRHQVSRAADDAQTRSSRHSRACQSGGRGPA